MPLIDLSQRIEMVGNTGTYIDAPSHRFADGKDIAKLRLDQVANLDAVVIDTHGFRFFAVPPPFVGVGTFTVRAFALTPRM